MTKYYVLDVNPNAKYDWERCTLRDPITADRPDLAHLIAEAVGQQTGSYLISVNIEVQVLEEASHAQIKQVPKSSELPARTALPQRQELVA
jgi:hypothetical protein